MSTSIVGDELPTGCDWRLRINVSGLRCYTATLPGSETAFALCEGSRRAFTLIGSDQSVRLLLDLFEYAAMLAPRERARFYRHVRRFASKTALRIRSGTYRGYDCEVRSTKGTAQRSAKRLGLRVIPGGRLREEDHDQ